MILFLILPVLALADEKSSPQSTQQADISCDQQYPWCKDKSGDIAGLVKNFYNYALAAVGVAALGAIIFGGVKYTVSAGNPSSQTDAISWITGAVWGLVLLLGANLLLRTINPKLIDMKLTHLESVKVDLYESKYKENTQLYKKLPSTQTFVEASEAYNDRKKKLEQQGLTKEKIAQTLSEEIAIGAQCKKYTNRKDDCIKYANESVSQFYNQQTNKIDYEDFEKTVDKKMVETGNMRWW